jgi:hypothetical protein
MKRIVAIVFALGLTACFPNYSNGTRIGVVTKLSESGMIFKSWEGEMLMALPDGVSAVNAEKFWFSVAPEAVEQVHQAMRDGRRVELHYRQWAMKPPTQLSNYTVDSVRPTN